MARRLEAGLDRTLVCQLWPRRDQPWTLLWRRREARCRAESHKIAIAFGRARRDILVGARWLWAESDQIIMVKARDCGSHVDAWLAGTGVGGCCSRWTRSRVGTAAGQEMVTAGDIEYTSRSHKPPPCLLIRQNSTLLAIIWQMIPRFVKRTERQHECEMRRNVDHYRPVDSQERC